MTILAAEPAHQHSSTTPRAAAAAIGLLLGLAVAGLVWRLSPPGALGFALLLGLMASAASIALALVNESGGLANLSRSFAVAALVVGGAALSRLPGEALERAFGLGSLGLAGFLTWRAVSAARLRIGRAAVALGAATILVLLGYNAWYVWASRDLEIADFMFYRLVSVAVAGLIDSGRIIPLVLQFANTMKADYSWLPGLAPGLALALGAPLSRAVYQAALMAFYAAPALVALGWLARELSFRAGADRSARRSVAALAVAIAIVAVTYPTGLAVTARGMPDIGGLALYVLALALADRLARSLSLVRAVKQVPRLAVALALTLFALFLFRRWYAFAAVGIVVTLAGEVAVLAWRQGRAFAWGATVQGAALAALVGLALVSPVLVDWLPDPAAHDYSQIYAAYRKPVAVFVSLVGDWWGFAILALSLAAAALLALRSAEARLLRLTWGGAIIGAALFLRVQTPYVHHVFLIAPAVTASIAAAELLAPVWLRALAFVALAAATLTPLGALAPKGTFPSYGQPHQPRADLAELARMKDWIDAHATPQTKVCGLGSSYTFSGQLMDELWQLKADRSPFHLNPNERTSVQMSDVDTVQGPPIPELKDCAFMLVGDPVQTHLIPSYQQTVVVPSQEMLSGQGVGAHYRRSGEVFSLENGVSAVAFERTSPLSDDDMAALAARWRAARSM